MDIKDLISKINESVDALDYASARKYIEENFELINHNRNQLKSNAREILIFLHKKKESGEEALTKMEINAITVINTYARRFDVRSLRLNIKGKEKLLLKEETLNYLNSDAKIILESIGAIEIKKNEK